jgi:putative hydrolase of HD superfamily
MGGDRTSDRLDQQLRFIIEIDKLKGVLRRTYLIDSGRRENTAEHSWHLALMAILLAEYSNEPVDVTRVVKMVLVHDIVEIDAGDTYFYDAAAELDKSERERSAADRVFALLPADQAQELRMLWEEFEACNTPDATFAAALDRFIPQLHNYHTQGKSWRENAITADRILERNASIAAGSTRLWQYVRDLIEDAVDQGFLSKQPQDR